MRPASLSPALEHAIAYVLDNPGKQLRARLTQASYLLLSDTHDVERVHSAATAIEWLHCYSLIHDDLPAMDNDDLRRGQATLHKAFDEATAILVGDGLQASAFELIASDDHLSHKQRTEVMTVIAQAVGFMGMVGGQALDMEAENKPSTITMLRAIHAGKTGALFRAAVGAGAVCAGATHEDRQQLDHFARAIGLAFQIMDDVLDATGSSEELGKTAGKDNAAAKTTYVSCLGLDEARAEVRRLHTEALDYLAPYGERAGALVDLANQMVDRRT